MSELIEQLNRLDSDTASEQFERCCGARTWVARMLEARPFDCVSALFAAADAAFLTLTKKDWLEAFSHHPKIGDIDSLRQKFASTHDWAGNEQAGTSAANEETLQGLAEGNRLYEEKFGYIFIICATGKSATQMLEALQERLPHSPEEELPLAAAEQQKITALRLQKLLDTLGESQS